MTPTLEQIVDRAWRALWRDGSPYHLPTALQHGRVSGHVRVPPLPSLPLPDVRDVVLLDRPPLGGVTLSLHDSRVEGLSTVEAEDLHVSPTGSLTARIRFTGLRCAGAHIVRTGHRTGAAIAAALSVLQPDATDDDSNLALAKTYQTQLIGMQSDNGRIMVASYYDNNDTYSELFQLPSFARVWATHTTNGQTTKFYANQTSVAAQPGNTGSLAVNGQPDAQGNSPYNYHSFFMQNFVMATCYKSAAFYGTNTDKGRRYQKAGDDAQKFGYTAQPPAMTSQTVDSVLATVSTSAPPSESDLLALRTAEPAWLQDARAKAQAIADDTVQRDLVEGGIDTASKARPHTGTYSGALPAITLSVAGVVVPGSDGGAPVARFTRIDGASVLVPIALSGVPEAMATEVGAALDRARFLQRLLGHRAMSAIASQTLLHYLTRHMNLALAQRLGATG